MSPDYSALFLQVRQAAGDNASSAARKAKISHVAYKKWEEGITKNFKYENLGEFCRSYGIDVDEFLRGRIVKMPSRPGAALKLQYSQEHILSEPNLDETILVRGFRLASAGIRHSMLVLARDAISSHEQEISKKNGAITFDKQ